MLVRRVPQHGLASIFFQPGPGLFPNRIVQDVTSIIILCCDTVLPRVRKAPSSIMATASTRRLVLAGYRNLLRATQQTFAGDAEALAASRVALRAAFVDNKNVTDKHELGAFPLPELDRS